MKKVHDLKSLMRVYSDYEWEDAEISVWQPDEQRNMEIIFSGSQRDDHFRPKSVNFIATYKDGVGSNCVLEAFQKTLDKIVDSKYDMSVNWENVFIKNMVELRSKPVEKAEPSSSLEQFKKLAKDLLNNIDECPSGMRRGQWIFNEVTKVFPEITQKVSSTDCDCFYRDDRIGCFLATCELLLDKK